MIIIIMTNNNNNDEQSTSREFKDVVFEDVVFDDNSFVTLIEPYHVLFVIVRSMSNLLL